jgi:hypothetical protein
MQYAADEPGRFEEHGEGLGNIVSNLNTLVEHIQASIDLIEGAIARETAFADQDGSNIVVLDDVTPQYMKASTALHSCRASLGTALQFLLDSKVSAHEPIQRSILG